jgi:hypothetical protein
MQHLSFKKCLSTKTLNMKLNRKLIYLSIIVLFSCTKNTEQAEQTGSFEPNIVANWKAIQWYFDPGNGSGQFTNITPGVNYFVNFSANGDFSANSLNLNSIKNFDKYKIDNSTRITLYKQFTTDSARIYYEFANFNKELIISFYGCREPCRLKHIRN